MTTKVLLPERCRDCEHHAWYDFKDDPNHWLCVFLGWQGSRISDPDSVPEWCPLMSVNQRNCPHCGTPYSDDTDEHGNRICGCDDETIARQAQRNAELEAALQELILRAADGAWHSPLDCETEGWDDCELCAAICKARAALKEQEA